MSKTLYMGVTITIGHKCDNRGEITKLNSHTHTCTNRKVRVLDPEQNIVQYRNWTKPLAVVNELYSNEYGNLTPNEILLLYVHT